MAFVPVMPSLGRLGIGLALLLAGVGCSSDEGAGDGSASTAVPVADAAAVAEADDAITIGTPADPDLALVDYYRDVVGSPAELAECLADAAAAESVLTVGDLEAAENDAVLATKLAEAQDTCLD